MFQNLKHAYMNRIILAFHFSIFVILSCAAQSANLSLHITQLKVIENSTVMIAIYNSEESYFDSEQMFLSAEIAVESAEAKYTFKDMPHDTYAIAIYHDEDNDGEMDRKWFGPPREGYAFSNNYHSTFKPASFDDAAFKLDADLNLDIQMRY